MDEQTLTAKFDELVRSGLVLYDENQQDVTHVDGEIEFHFLLTPALNKKPTLGTPRPEPSVNDEDLKMRNGSDIDTRGFEICNIGKTHFLAANKFCFARPQFMLVTLDGYRRQYEPLDEADFEAAWSLLSAMTSDYIVFFNGGKDAGCSRLHKHLQAMPTPSESFASFLDNGRSEPDLPFQWFHKRLDGQQITPAVLANTYEELLQQASETPGSQRETILPGDQCPHNMIMTKRWMIVIPRRKAAINKTSGANALGMLGVVAISSQDEVRGWTEFGLKEALKVLGVPK